MTIPIYDSIQTGRNIRQLRLQNHMTQEQLGNLLGVTSQCVYSYEIARTDLSIEMACALAKVFNCDVLDICSVKGMEDN